MPSSISSNPGGIEIFVWVTINHWAIVRYSFACWEVPQLFSIFFLFLSLGLCVCVCALNIMTLGCIDIYFIVIYDCLFLFCFIGGSGGDIVVFGLINLIWATVARFHLYVVPKFDLIHSLVLTNNWDTMVSAPFSTPFFFSPSPPLSLCHSPSLSLTLISFHFTLEMCAVPDWHTLTTAPPHLLLHTYTAPTALYSLSRYRAIIYCK